MRTFGKQSLRAFTHVGKREIGRHHGPLRCHAAYGRVYGLATMAGPPIRHREQGSLRVLASGTGAQVTQVQVFHFSKMIRIHARTRLSELSTQVIQYDYSGTRISFLPMHLLSFSL